MEKNFDEDARGGGGFFFVEVDDGKDVPCYGVRGEEVAEEAGNVAEAIGFVAMDCAVVLQQELVTSSYDVSDIILCQSWLQRAPSIGG